MLSATVAWSADKDKKEPPAVASARKKLETKVTVDYKEERLDDIVKDLKKQVENLSIHVDNAGGVSNNITLTCKAADKPLSEVLDELFKKTDLGYVIGYNTDPKYRYTGWLIIKKGKFRGEMEGAAPATAAKPADKVKPKDKPPADKPADTKPESKAEKAEKDAASSLRVAKKLAADGLVDKAKARYKEIIEKYPNTKAAKEAQQLLDK
jgi:hypothetical protein